MEPLRTFFPRLKEEEVELFVRALWENGSVKTCVICNKTKLSGSCSDCLFVDRNAKDVLIESFIPLVMSISKRIGGTKRNDIVSVGLLALTEAINNIPPDIRSLEAYVRSTVAGKIKTFLINDTVIQVPSYGVATHKHLKSTMTIANDIPVSGEQTSVDLSEIINSIPRNKKESIILSCLLEGGYSLRDMADMCGVERARVSQIKHDLLDRLHTVLRKELLQ
jgi:RNA polymerase sigma factor (sigma-70 family)